MKKLAIKKTTSDFFFRLGLASIFLVNSLTAWLAPNEFAELLKNNFLASAFASPEFLVRVIGVNDGLLFLLILFGRWRKTIAIWAALWVITVIYVTISEGVIEFIGHIGILSFIIYYYFAFQRSSVK